MRLTCILLLCSAALTLSLRLLTGSATAQAQRLHAERVDYSGQTRIQYKPITGISDELDSGFKRRDPSDIIKVGDTYYVWYTKVFDLPGNQVYPEAFERGTVYYASSKNGWDWTELGEALGLGEPGKFDDQAVFTPNILQSPADGKFYLYYTGVADGDRDKVDWSVWDTPSHIGVAMSEGVNSDGTFQPFVRANNADPVVLAEPDSESVLDGWHVDDAVLFYRPNNGLVDGEGTPLGDYWLYYKGWSPAKRKKDQRNGTGLAKTGGNSTPMMLATSNDPTAVFTKVRGMGPGGRDYLIASGHELLVTHNADQYVAVVTGHYNPDVNEGKYKVHTSVDGLRFKVASDQQVQGINALRAPGAYRPDLTDHNTANVHLTWGLSQTGYGGNQGLHRFTVEAE